MPIYGVTTQAASNWPRHPSLSWANWKNGKWIIWDRDKAEEAEIEMPEALIVVAEWWSVKGYLEAKGWVYSNEIYSFAKDPLTIRSTNGEILYEWLWNEIKDKVKAVGLKLTKNVHYIDPEKPDELRTFCIKWAGMKSWLDTFTGDARFASADHLICFWKVKEGKTWAVKYTYPTFNVCDKLTPEQKTYQQKWWTILVGYQEAINMSAEEAKNDEVARDDVDELPFN